MSSTTVDRPAVEVERASRAHIAALMLKAVRDHSLAYPRAVTYMEECGDSRDLLGVDIDSRAEWLAWIDFLGEPIYRDVTSVHIPWLGWTVMLHDREQPRELDAGTVALIDEVTAPTVHLIHRDWSRECGRSDEHGSITLSHVTCPDCLRLAAHRAQVRRELTEALAAGPSVLSTHPHDAIQAALADGVIVEHGQGETGRTVYALAGCPRCGHQDDPIHVCPAEPVIVGTPVEISGRLGELLSTSRIDVASVSAQFPSWPRLTVAQQGRLVELCGLTGWDGDWTACYRQMLTDDSLVTDDDARVVVSELDDLPHVSLEQLAEAATVGPDERPYVPADDSIIDPTAADSPLRALDGMGAWSTPFAGRTDSEAADLDGPTVAIHPVSPAPAGVELIRIDSHKVRAPEDAYHVDEAGRGDAGISHLTGAGA